MKQRVKAALLSIAVFPGAGHFYAKKHRAGALFAVIAALCVCWLVVIADDLVREMLAGISSGRWGASIGELEAVLRQLWVTSYLERMQVPGWGLIATWLVSTLDAWRVGHALDAATPTASP